MFGNKLIQTERERESESEFVELKSSPCSDSVRSSKTLASVHTGQIIFGNLIGFAAGINQPYNYKLELNNNNNNYYYRQTVKGRYRYIPQDRRGNKRLNGEEKGKTKNKHTVVRASCLNK